MAVDPDPPVVPTPDEERALAVKTASEIAATALALSTLVTTLVQRVEALEATDTKLVAEELVDAAETKMLAKIVMALQSQWLWLCAAMLLIGAAADHVLTSWYG